MAATTGRGPHVLRLSDLSVGDLIAPGTAVRLRTDDGKGRRYVTSAVYLRATGATGPVAVAYTLAETSADVLGRPRVREFEVPAALVELADPPPADVADELTATTPGGRIVWRQDYPGGSIRDAAGRYTLYYSDEGLPTPIFFAADAARPGEKHSPNGILAEVKAWCEARLNEPLTACDTATAAGVNGVPQTVPAAELPDF